MKNAVRLILFGFLFLSFTACSDNPNKFTGAKGTPNDIKAVLDKNGDSALKFLSGARDGDKKLMYEATNLTTDLVEQNRDKLVYPARYKQTEAQRKDSEDILRISGEIDYFSGTLRKLFPKSTTFQITRTDMLGLPNGAKGFDHSVALTYVKRSEALSDKTGKAVKVMTIHLLQSNKTVEGRVIQSFSFDGRGFDRFADKDFEVVSYY